MISGKHYKKCEVCGEFFLTKKSHLVRRKTCSVKCVSKKKAVMYKGEDNPNFGNKGDRNPMYKGWYISNLGYKWVNCPEHPNSTRDGYILEHRLVISNHLGRPLTAEEIVHHKDEDKLNNSIDNLKLMSRSDHARHHNSNFRISRGELGRIESIERCEREDE